MELGPIEAPVPVLAAGAFAIAVVGVLLVAASTSGAAFGPHNPGWEGLSEVRDAADEAGVETAVATDREDYAAVQHDGTVVLVVAPADTTSAWRAQLRTLVENGGTVVVAARDPAETNRVLSTLGTEVRVDGAPLRDEREYDPTPAFPLATDVANHSYVRGAEGLTLNHGTALATADALEARETAAERDEPWPTYAIAAEDSEVWRAEDGPRALANTSEYAYLDRDGSDQLDPNERLDSRPVVAVESVGRGQVVTVGDPSAVINVMMERDANRAFVANVLADHERLIVDRTGGEVPPLVGALGAIRTSPTLGALAGLALLGGVLAWERRPLRGLRARWRDWRSDEPAAVVDARPDRDALRAYLADRYPELDDAQRERVLGGIMNVEEKFGHDDRGD